MLTGIEIYKVVNYYIGVQGGYLGDFSYNSHAEFYPGYCDLDIDPNDYEGTTRNRFIEILRSASPSAQVKILKGILARFPISYFPEEEQEKKRKVADDISQIIERLEAQSPIDSPDLSTTSEVVEKAIQDAKTLINESGATSGVDRIHTALHGYLKAICEKEGYSYLDAVSLTQLFKILREKHPSLQYTGPRQQDINKVLNSLSNILDSLNPLRNRSSIAHPNTELLDEEEAMLVINSTNTILHYLNSKFR